jgi:transaldolase
MSSGTEYDAPLEALVEQGMRDPKELFLNLAIKDIKDACDMLLPTYEDAGGLDGFVSLEVSPDLAYDTDATINEARNLFKAVGKKNALIKVPATKEGLPAIERLTAEGVNVNITLLFSVKRYVEVTKAYLNGIERRIEDNMPVNEIVSVASFFVSRVDTLTDKLLSDVSDQGTARALMGRAAVANARLAYQELKQIFSGKRFMELKDHGANIQRLLWGSSGTKDPAYSDIKYIE